ncbi:hypothetical protein Pcinc_036302 [Petrolisthes cinctipes]|uniref:Uncharacterized protein n=1 Tax=Petrolisthes cinctipes TaxID=88211 RepID=A0AAE1BY43_PETCI|nr:hypothetical protein Pcinc_036302 [Petrolisthes cinctipes]
MKFLVLSCLVVVAVALPQYDPRDQEATVIVDERSDNGDGNFQYRFQTSNGIETQKVGVPGTQGQSKHERRLQLHPSRRHCCSGQLRC